MELQRRLATPGNRIEEAHVLQARAALPLAAVGHYHVVEGLIAPTAPRQAYGYHTRNALVQGWAHPAQKSADSTGISLLWKARQALAELSAQGSPEGRLHRSSGRS
jgi:hypothetical protein